MSQAEVQMNIQIIAKLNHILFTLQGEIANIKLKHQLQICELEHKISKKDQQIQILRHIIFTKTHSPTKNILQLEQSKPKLSSNQQKIQLSNLILLASKNQSSNNILERSHQYCNLHRCIQKKKLVRIFSKRLQFRSSENLLKYQSKKAEKIIKLSLQNIDRNHSMYLKMKSQKKKNSNDLKLFKIVNRQQKNDSNNRQNDQNIIFKPKRQGSLSQICKKRCINVTIPIIKLSVATKNVK